LGARVNRNERLPAGGVYRSECKGDSGLVHHPPVSPAFGYRFDTAERPAIDRMVARVPNARSLKQSILSHHTSAEDAGRVAREDGVKMLVLSHLIPPDDPEVTAQMWADAARRNFDGEIVVGTGGALGVDMYCPECRPAATSGHSS
jgi:hypothetical protein